MTQIPEKLYSRLLNLSNNLQKKLYFKGFVIPYTDDNGSVIIGNYKIIKQDKFFLILDFENEVVVDQINLPQTAAILANNMALGKCLDKDILSIDRKYGYAMFEEELHKKIAEKNLKKNIDRADMSFTKAKLSKHIKEQCRVQIVRSFEKLHKFA